MFKTTATTQRTGRIERYVIDFHGEEIYAYTEGTHSKAPYYLDTIFPAAKFIVVNWSREFNGWDLPVGAMSYEEAREIADRRSIVAEIV